MNTQSPFVGLLPPGWKLLEANEYADCYTLRRNSDRTTIRLNFPARKIGYFIHQKRGTPILKVVTLLKSDTLALFARHLDITYPVEQP